MPLHLSALLRATLPTLIAATAIATTPAGAEPEVESDFDSSLHQAELLMGVQKWARARSTLIRALEEHEGQPYVLGRLDEVKDDLKRCEFWTTRSRPRPEDVVDGELVSYSTYNHELELRYLRSRSRNPWSADFERVRDILLHPAILDGPYTIELRGRVSGADDQATVFANVGEDSFHAVVFGRTTGVLQMVGEKTTVLDRVGVELATGSAFAVQVRVDGSSISIFHEGRRLASVARPRGPYGRFGFTDGGAVEEIVLSGRIEPSWLEQRIDAEIQGEWAEFERSYDAEEDLPEWLRGGAPRISTKSTTRETTPEDQEHVEHAEMLYRFEKYDEGLAYARRISSRDSGPALREWLQAYFLEGRGDLTEALKHCDRAIERDPMHFRSRNLRAELTMALEPRPAVVEEYRKLLEDFPTEVDAYGGYALSLLLVSRHADAKRVLDEAARKQIRSEELGLLRKTLARALNGPQWSTTHEYRSKNYHVFSDIDQKICFDAAQVLETAHRKFSKHVRALPPGQYGRFRVYLFSGQQGYLSYARDLTGDEPHNTAGMFSTLLKQLLVWNLLEREEMMRTIRHECLHQYMDLLVDEAPIWLEEGLGEYFARSELVRGYWTDGAMQPEYVAQLHAPGNELVPLAEFLFLDTRGFYGGGVSSYAQAWGWVHFLLNTGSVHRKSFNRLMDHLVDGKTPSEATRRAFASYDLGKLQVEFEAYVAGLGAE